jgi:hypothetical protein
VDKPCAKLLLDDVDAGDLLRHRVFHLHARVDLDEEVPPLLVYEELDGS